MVLDRKTIETKALRIGILGGMGPAAGVRLQDLIVKLTPASKDQEHLQVMCFTNPHIPDRTLSLEKDGGRDYVEAMIDSLRVLEAAGSHVIAIPCNTAHARFEELQSATKSKIVNMVHLAVEYVKELFSGYESIGLLATDGTNKEKVYQSIDQDLNWHVISEADQSRIMKAIYLAKAGDLDKAYEAISVFVGQLIKEDQIKILVLGCTELSLFAKKLRDNYPQVNFVDPLEILAAHLVKMAKSI